MAWATLAIIFVALAHLRPVDHDESQYVAATVLTAHGLLPYRDFAYLQTPLQPFLFAPIAWIAGCDILLFGIGTARNDALPVALLAAGCTCCRATGRSSRRER